MSRLIDRLNAASEAAPQPMGFGVGPAPEKPRMQLVASLSQVDFDRLADYSTGADAGVVRVSSSSEVKILEKVCLIREGIPWGGWLRGISHEGIAKLVKAGCDFVVFPADTPLAMLRDDKLGRILEIDTSLGEDLLRTIDNLPVDAVLASSDLGKGLTWHHLLLFQRLTGVLTKPVLASVPPKVSASELQVLWAIGVNGVVLEVGDEQSAERLSTLRQEIDKLTLSTRKRRKMRALLPRISAETEIPAGDEEEEE